MKCELTVLGEKENCFGLQVGGKKSHFYLIDKYMTRFDSSFGGHKHIYTLELAFVLSKFLWSAVNMCFY